MRRSMFAVLIVLFVAFNAWALYTFVTSKYPGANDFYQRWYGARAFWVQGRDPYSPEVAREVELTLYRMPASTDPALDQYPGDFLYPFPMAILIAPLTFLDYATASAIWLALMGASTALTFVLMADLFNWRPSPAIMFLGIVWAVTFYPSVRGIFLGQQGVFTVILELVAVWGLAKKHDVVAGIALSVSTFKPQLGFLIIPFLILWAIRYRRWRFLISSAVTMAVLLGLSFLLLPSWLSEWLVQATQYTGYTRIGSPVWVLTQKYLPFLGSTGEAIISAILVLLVLWAWWRELRNPQWFNWTAALTLTVTHLVLTRTATPHFVVYLIVIVFYFRELNKVHPLLLLAAMVVLTVGLWWLFLTTLFGRLESYHMYTPIPFLSLALLLFTARRWQEPRERLIA
jgi:hypothetical protein